MPSFQILSGLERRACLFVAGIASLGTLSASLLAFFDAGSTPWFAPRSELAVAALHCDSSGSGRRHACLRELGRVAQRSRTAVTALAQLEPTRPLEAGSQPPQEPRP